MLRQLARLTRPLPAAGPGALAVAVYARPDGELLPAREAGFEGVACVDDAARVLGLLARVWAATPLDPIRAWAEGLTEFVLWMREDDGGWLNFVEDWDGTRNATGITSATGENFWQARAVEGLARASLVFGDARATEAVEHGLERARSMVVPADVRALHLRAALELVRAGWTGLLPDVRRWADEIAERREHHVLMNNPDERGDPHLWAHIQEGVLADAGVLLDDHRLVDRARRSAEAFLEPIVRKRFDLPTVTAYDVASVVYGFDRLEEACDGPWDELAAEARAWFDGRNPAGAVVYDRERGRVADGLDGDRLNGNSGAESNVEAGEALLEAAIASAPRIGPGPRVR